MHLSVHFENTKDEPEKKGSVDIGWLIDQDRSSVIFYPPERVRTVDINKEHAKSASRCPAVIGLESRYFLIRCPFDLHLAFTRDDNGRPVLRNLDGDKSAVRSNKIKQHINIAAEKEWRQKNVPTIQVSLPYLFIADEPVFMTQTPPFMHYNKTPWPGVLFGGRFPINIWPRHLMWAFEWYDTSKPLKIKRGEPMFYAGFETLPQSRTIRMIEAEDTPELREYLNMISGAVNYVNQTFSLFEEAEARRPSQLVKRLTRK